jgi:hypothetical protein
MLDRVALLHSRDGVPIPFRMDTVFRVCENNWYGVPTEYLVHLGAPPTSNQGSMFTLIPSRHFPVYELYIPLNALCDQNRAAKNQPWRYYLPIPLIIFHRHLNPKSVKASDR